MALVSPRAAAARSSIGGGGQEAGRVHVWTVVVGAAVLAVVASSTTYVVTSLRSVPAHLPAAPQVIALPAPAPAPPAVAAPAPSTETTRRAAVRSGPVTTTSSTAGPGAGLVRITTPVVPPTASVAAPSAPSAPSAPASAASPSSTGPGSQPSPTTPTTLPVPVRNASDSHFIGLMVVTESVSAPVLVAGPTPSVPVAAAPSPAANPSESGWPVPEPPAEPADVVAAEVPAGSQRTMVESEAVVAGVVTAAGDTCDDVKATPGHARAGRPAGARGPVPPRAVGRAVVSPAAVPLAHRDHAPGGDGRGRPHH